MKKLLAIIFVGLLCLVFILQIIIHKEIKGMITSLKYNGQEEICFNRCILQKVEPKNVLSAEDFWYQFKLTEGNNEKYYYFNDTSYMFEPREGAYFKPCPKTKIVIDNAVAILEKGNPFGSLEEWTLVDKLFPRMSKGVIRDLETGLCFHVQRRAGSLHADVQPLTKEDTAVLKCIYDGRWSWKRRAVILEKDNKKIAASINGMPHGKGAISANNFPGHFCIHFLNSSTHSSNIDLAHQLMVWKAAGKLENYLKKKNKEEMIRTAFTAVAQNDPYLVVSCFKIDEGLIEMLRYMKSIANIKVINIEKNKKSNDYSVLIEWYEYGKAKKNSAKIRVRVEQANNKYLIQTVEFLKKSTYLVD